jgi:hypothetical protein
MKAVKFKVVECIFTPSPIPSLLPSQNVEKTFKGNLSEGKARALAEKLNAKQDLASGDEIRNYYATTV